MSETTRLELVVPVTASRNWYSDMNNNLALLDRISVCARLTNEAGVMLERGDVVVVDTSNNESVKLTTTLNDSSIVGVVFDDTIVEDEAGLVVVCGYCEAIKVVTAGGDISPGDKLCAAANQGYAQKATWYQYTFASALESASTTGAISGFITPQPIAPDAMLCYFDVGLFDIHLFGT